VIQLESYADSEMRQFKCVEARVADKTHGLRLRVAVSGGARVKIPPATTHGIDLDF
jgi:hypothetical protein